MNRGWNLVRQLLIVTMLGLAIYSLTYAGETEITMEMKRLVIFAGIIAIILLGVGWHLNEQEQARDFYSSLLDDDSADFPLTTKKIDWEEYDSEK